MKQTVYMLVGVPASGKSWVAEQLKHKFTYLPHDAHINKQGGSGSQTALYLKEIMGNLVKSKKPILIETPFSMSILLDPLTKAKVKVIPVFVIEKPEVLVSRYTARGGADYPQSHLVRQETYKSRIPPFRAFSGTSQEVFDYLCGI